MSGSIELIARAVIIDDGRILVAHKHGASNTFLPGGHIEHGEPSEVALLRELEEEMGISANIAAFMGVFEYQFIDEYDRHMHEINLVYEVSLQDHEVISAEGHLEFKWIKMDKAREHNLLPEKIIDLVKQWLEISQPVHMYANTT
ncbi:MAG: NUDIX domain-containing protein [Candidatus Bathyarchaeota archaeon]|nr:NUDIX domain-containing protein [Candidatus Bathyarchaeota archaeon]